MNGYLYLPSRSRNKGPTTMAGLNKVIRRSKNYFSYFLIFYQKVIKSYSPYGSVRKQKEENAVDGDAHLYIERAYYI